MNKNKYMNEAQAEEQLPQDEAWQAWALEQGDILEEAFGVDFIEVAQENEEFMEVLVNQSMPLIKAYIELIHDPELIERTQSETLDALMKRNTRIPSPVGRSKNKGAALDVASLSDKDVLELDKKARYGAKIVL